MKTNEQKQLTEKELAQATGGGNGSAKNNQEYCSSLTTAKECQSTKGRCAWHAKHEKCLG